jgi:hypothetical protein
MSADMRPDLPAQPWQHKLFTPETPVEIILILARAFCSHAEAPATEVPEQGALDTSIAGMLAAELHRRNVDYREVPWPLRLLWVRLTGQPEGQPPRRPDTP